MQSLSWQGSLSLLIASTRRKLKQLYMRRLAEHGLTPAQMSAMFCLDEAGELCLKSLAAHARTDEPTASRLVTRLVATGKVRMKVDADDRRRTRLALTPAGRALTRRLRPLAAEVEATLLSELSDSEHRALTSGLRKVSANMERASAKPTPRARRSR
jgi:DNA-binding MarR family transcriptional regulator